MNDLAQQQNAEISQQPLTWELIQRTGGIEVVPNTFSFDEEFDVQKICEIFGRNTEFAFKILDDIQRHVNGLIMVDTFYNHKERTAWKVAIVGSIDKEEYFRVWAIEDNLERERQSAILDQKGDEIKQRGLQFENIYKGVNKLSVNNMSGLVSDLGNLLLYVQRDTSPGVYELLQQYHDEAKKIYREYELIDQSVPLVFDSEDAAIKSRDSRNNAKLERANNMDDTFVKVLNLFARNQF